MHSCGRLGVKWVKLRDAKVSDEEETSQRVPASLKYVKWEKKGKSNMFVTMEQKMSCPQCQAAEDEENAGPQCQAAEDKEDAGSLK